MLGNSAMNSFAAGHKDTGGAAPSLLVWLNCRAGVNLQNGGRLVPGLDSLEGDECAVNRLESQGGSSFATVFPSSCMAYTRVLDF
jgi:hypothetical protein